jgi:hypothetical protein
VVIQCAALALTLGTVARVFVGRSGALVAAAVAFALAMSCWAIVWLVDARRGGRSQFGLRRQ